VLVLMLAWLWKVLRRRGHELVVQFYLIQKARLVVKALS
jgi:hypothetical protein